MTVQSPGEEVQQSGVLHIVGRHAKGYQTLANCQFLVTLNIDLMHGPLLTVHLKATEMYVHANTGTKMFMHRIHHSWNWK